MGSFRYISTVFYPDWPQFDKIIAKTKKRREISFRPRCISRDTDLVDGDVSMESESPHNTRKRSIESRLL